VQHLKIKEK